MPAFAAIIFTVTALWVSWIVFDQPLPPDTDRMNSTEISPAIMFLTPPHTKRTFFFASVLTFSSMIAEIIHCGVYCDFLRRNLE